MKKFKNTESIVKGLILMLILSSQVGFASDRTFSHKKIYQMSRQEIDLLLPTLQKQYTDFASRFHALALLRLGTPYNFKAIGEGSGIEPNPVFRIDQTNCTAFVLTNMALASAANYQQAESLMTYLNYYPAPEGKNPITYENRRHFTADRLQTSDYFELITTAIARSEELDTIRLILNRQEDGSHFLPIAWEKEIELPFIPKAFITRELLERLPTLCGVGVIQKDLFKKGIIIAHEGILFDRSEFFHASKYKRKLVREDFYRYTRKKKFNGDGPVCDGIVLYLMKPVEK